MIIGPWLLMLKGFGCNIVNVGIEANWKTSYLAEASEFYYSKSPALFWDFVNQLECTGSELDMINQFNQAMVDQKRLKSHDLELLDMALATRYYSPLVQAYQSLSQDAINCKGDSVSAVVFGGSEFSNLDVGHLDSSFGHGTSEGAIHVFGDLADPSFCSNWKRIERQGAKYCFYHFSKRANATIDLAGYGVELVYKNTEYNTTDDSIMFQHEIQSPRLPTDQNSDCDNSKSQLPDLDDLKNQLADLSKKHDHNNAVNISLGEGAMQWIHSQSNKVQTLKSMTQNFPLYQDLLPRLEKGPKSTNVSGISSQVYRVLEGSSLLVINGFVFEAGSTSLFKLFSWLDQWIKHYTILRSLDIDRTLGKTILHPFLDEDHGIVVDLQSLSILWLLKQDSDRYQVADTIICFDPLDTSQIELMIYLASLLRHAGQLNLGLCLVDNVGNNGYRHVAQTIHRIYLGYGAKMVFFVFKMALDLVVSNTVEELTSKVIASILIQAKIPKQVVDQIVNMTPTAQDLEWIGENARIGKGLQRIRGVSIFVNGQLVESQRPEDLLRDTERIYSTQMKWFSKHAESLGLDKVNWTSEFIKHHKAWKSVNPILLAEAEYFQMDIFQRWEEFHLGAIEIISLDRTQGQVQDNVWFSTRFDRRSVEFIVEFLDLCQCRKNLNVYLIAKDGVIEWPKSPLTFSQGIQRLRDGIESPRTELPEHVRFMECIGGSSGDVLIINGRIIRLESLCDQLSVQDVDQMLDTHNPSRKLGQAVIDQSIVRNQWLNEEKILVFVESIRGSIMEESRVHSNGHAVGRSRVILEYLELISGIEECSFESKASESGRLFDIHVFVDVLGKDAPKLAEWIEALSEYNMIGVKVTTYTGTEIPARRFYRYCFGSTRTRGSRAEFSNLPVDLVMTVEIDSVSSWLVLPSKSERDLDNFKLVNRDGAVDVRYRLEHVVVEGQCRDESKRPVRGVQLVLNAGNRTLDGTMAMETLGYFQLKAEPGIFEIGLMPGTSKSLRIVESRGVVVVTHEPAFTRVMVGPRSGYGNWSILDLWDGWSKSIWAVKPRETINIFSVASGYLYERLLRIMIQSVMSTKDPQDRIKFWFIGNFLGPKFVDQLFYLSKALGFEYELVTYKWPIWLREQTDKQRRIWGYKILFLDVLFPQDLHRVIFLDADLIVRSSLRELVELDMGPSPYGFTPFGDSNLQMEGFRFWKRGYWKSRLGSKKYHISALFVVDLDRFREMGAGDILRQQYQLLSGDPNSLANLDQDLPNNIQDIVPIYSLPEEWCWCETWCSRDMVSRAKAVDLCNNPMTKESKLERARRLIPEWNQYDQAMSKAIELYNEFKRAEWSAEQDMECNGRQWQAFYQRAVEHLEL